MKHFTSDGKSYLKGSSKFWGSAQVQIFCLSLAVNKQKWLLLTLFWSKRCLLSLLVQAYGGGEVANMVLGGGNGCYEGLRGRLLTELGRRVREGERGPRTSRLCIDKSFIKVILKQFNRFLNSFTCLYIYRV